MWPVWYWMLEPDTTCTSLPAQHPDRPAVHILFTWFLFPESLPNTAICQEAS